jgi:hypothetical protein
MTVVPILLYHAVSAEPAPWIAPYARYTRDLPPPRGPHLRKRTDSTDRDDSMRCPLRSRGERVAPCPERFRARARRVYRRAGGPLSARGVFVGSPNDHVGRTRRAAPGSRLNRRS